MNVFALGDLHLSAAVNKPMDIFSDCWKNHDRRIMQVWRSCVRDEDVVLLPGDFSWAMKLEEAAADFLYLESLPGRKVMIRGNHDYWWGSLTKVREALPKSVHAIQNDAVSYGDLHVSGTRGWACPGSTGFTKADEKIYQREICRLRFSLERLPKEGFRVVMLHYPPHNEKREESGFTQLIESYNVDMVVYGHLHGRSCACAYEGMRGGIQYQLVSADHLNFTPLLIKSDISGKEKQPAP